VQAIAQSARADVRCSGEVPAKIESLLNGKVFINPLAGFLADLGKLIPVEKHDPLRSQAERDASAKIFYQNTKPLVQTGELLIVTRLPRAGLSDLQMSRSASF
jgi:hypothetical protein